MKNTDKLLEAIRNCEYCYGKGVVGWVAPDGDYDFEYCDCNPENLILDDNGKVIEV